MNAYDAAEQAYKRGYEQGKKDARKKGKWMWEGRFKACSQCCSYIDWDDTLGANHWSFCPYCGADMRGEEDDNS